MNSHSASGKAVLFDVDGTLLDTVPLILEAYQYIFRKFLGHPLGDDEVLAGIGEPLDIYLKKQFPDDLANAMLEAYLVYYRSQMETSIGIFLHVPRMIEKLAERGIPLAIVTSKRQGSAVHNLGMFGLTDHFQAVISKESTKKHTSRIPNRHSKPCGSST